jgi:hypothetical protein
VARVRRDSETGSEGTGTSYGYRPPTIENNEMVGYCGSGMKTAPRPRRSPRAANRMRNHAKMAGILVVFVAALAVISAVALAPSDKGKEIPNVPAETSGTLPPVADFVVWNSTLNVIFDATTSYDPDGTIVSYDWVFGDGAVDSGVNVTHTYATWGTWWITLTVTDDDAMTGTTSMKVNVSNPSQPPPPPYSVFGYVYDSLGNLAFSASVTVTDVTTGAVWTTITDTEYGYYLVDLESNETGWDMGDTILVEITLGTDAGFNTGVAAGGYLQLDVSMVAIPEFPMVIVPVVGMIAIAAVVSFTRRRDEK